jgi:nitrite reductase/ring-hydroxylating ferredoxin subunit
MLSKEDNDIVCRVGPGTVGGDLFRQYWLPACLSSELAEPDCAPLRVRLLGEDLLAFRDTSGRVGLLEAYCPHRTAHLFFGRNEEDGLRCVYHGWKFDVEGKCLDLPNEPPESNFQSKVRAKAYPCVEKGNIVFTYMGPASPPPPFPEFEFATLPDDHTMVTRSYQEQNWLQALEGDIDPTHSPYLHSGVTPEAMDEIIEWSRSELAKYRFQRHGWHFDSVNTEFGMMLAGWVPAEKDTNFWRISNYLLPCFSQSGTNYGESPFLKFTAWVPIDDEHVSLYNITYHPLHPMTASGLRSSSRISSQFVEQRNPQRPGSEWQRPWNKRNDYMIDREEQRTKTYTGIPMGAQDQAIQESMGAIANRTKEHLGQADLGMIATRRAFLRAAKALRDHGTTPPGVRNPEIFMVRAPSKLLPKEERNWVEVLKPYYMATPLVNLAMP